MVQHVQVELGARSYPIRVGGGLLGSLGELCRSQGLNGHALVVSDRNVDPLYGPAVEESLRAEGYVVGRTSVPAGERSKERDTLFHLYDAALDQGLDRHAFIVALGGGVVGDLAGYLAASYLRGIDFVQVPTSVLAMVDSSVGGKTGINLPRGKNLVGAFHQPRAVLIDLDTLRTLPPRERNAGLAEVVKYGIIHEEAFFSELASHADRLRTDQGGLMTGVVAHCCRIKAEVVSDDERERGRRAILNFGHTLGHAVEKAGGYGHYLHGEAVAVGMAYAAALSVRAAGLTPAEAGRIVELLRRLDLPVAAPELSWPAVRDAMNADKKGRGGRPRFVLVPAIGRALVDCEVGEALLEEAWRSLAP